MTDSRAKDDGCSALLNVICSACKSKTDQAGENITVLPLEGRGNAMSCGHALANSSPGLCEEVWRSDDVVGSCRSRSLSCITLAKLVGKAQIFEDAGSMSTTPVPPNCWTPEKIGLQWSHQDFKPHRRSVKRALEKSYEELSTM